MGRPSGSRAAGRDPADAPELARPEEPAAEPGLRALHQVAASLRVRDFRLWFSSQLVSNSGTMLQGVAQAWLVLRLTGSGIDLGAVSACSMLPVLIGSPIAGGVVDRFDKRRMLLFTQTTFTVLAVALGLLTTTGLVRLWMVFLSALLTGTVAALDWPLRQVFVVDLVGSGRTASAVSLNEVVINVSRVVGPATGGALLATVGVATCFYVNAATFVLPIAALLSIHPRPARAGDAVPEARGPAGAAARGTPPDPVAPPAAGRLARARRSLAEGVAYSWRVPLIRYAILMAAASGILFNASVAMPLLATRTFHLGGGGYGAMMAAFGAGAIAGAMVAGSGDAFPSARRVRHLALATGLLVLAASAMPDFPAELVTLAVVGAISIWFISLANTLVQLRADARVRGRVMGLWVMALPGLGVVTGPLAGVVAQTLGPRPAFGLGGAALVVTAAAGWRTFATRDPFGLASGEAGGGAAEGTLSPADR